MRFRLTKKESYVLLIALVIALLMHIFGIPPIVTVLVGFGIWIAMLVAPGYMEGNPYKRMVRSSLPSFVMVSQYHKRREQELQHEASSEVGVFMFLLGLVLVIAGILSGLFPWSIWSVL